MRADRIYLKDLRRCMLCFSGTRAFMEAHNLSWDEFRKEGICIETVRATGDAMALELVRYVEGGRRGK